MSIAHFLKTIFIIVTALLGTFSSVQSCPSSGVLITNISSSDSNVTFTCNSPLRWYINSTLIISSTNSVYLSSDNNTLIVSRPVTGTLITCIEFNGNNKTYCISVQTPPTNSTRDTSIYIYIAAGIGGGLALIIIIIILIVIIACFCMICRREAESPSSPLIRQLSVSRHDKRSIRKSTVKLNDPVDEYRRQTHTEAMALHPVILKDHFPSHLAVMRMNDNQRFMEEFNTIPMVAPQVPQDNATTDYNMPKNRYDNILPYDHSRVKLSTVKWQEGSDYINANYLDGFMKPRQYIATQGPTASTIGEFWRMIWEQNSRTIVMVTRLQEKATIKCEQYWPNELNSPFTYGGIDVTLVEVVPLANYTFRTFSIVKGGSKDIREVKQFHFTAWPDHGVPEFPTSMLAMTRCVRAHHDRLGGTGPMVVHCSAGVGRTGTFIVIDSMVQRILHGENTIDIYGHVCLLRNQRCCMVQTEDQYFFIHEALNEAIACGVTEVTAEEFPLHLDKLEVIQEDGESSLLELEFQRLATDRTEPHRFASATKNINKGKNRFVNIMPYEYNRVKLSFMRATEGSDYINASYIDSYRQQKAFLATQGPMRNTVSDFWRMIWEHKSPIIVMLTHLEERQQECSYLYWSDREDIISSDITIKLSSKREVGVYIERQFSLTHKEQPGTTHTVRHFQFLGWPERGVPTSALPLLQLVQNVQEYYITCRTTQPVTVMCSSGVGRTGVFITLHIILERYAVEGLLDLFQTVKTLRIQRSAMVQTREQYHFCYDAVLDYLLNTGQLPQMRSFSMDRRASVYRSPPTAHSPQNSNTGSGGGQGELTVSTVELGSAFNNSPSKSDNNRTSVV